MGNFSSKDSHGPTGAHGESFHTPPTSPQTEGPVFMPAVPQLHHPTSSRPSHAAPVSPPPPVPVVTSSGKKSLPGTSSPAPDWKPWPPVSSSSSAVGSGVSQGHSKTGTTVVKEHVSLGKNGGPPTSTPRTPVSQWNTAAGSPTKCPSSLCGASPVEGGSSGKNWGERDSGLSQSLLPGHEAGDGRGEELEKLLEECRTTLGITASQDGAMDTTDILKHLLTEVKNLKSTLQTERGEWLQFQADLQVAVSVADRLRAEAEEELTALRTAHNDIERELAVAQQRQKEADQQLITLREELKESKQKLASLTQEQGKTDTQVPCLEPERPNGHPNNKSDSNEVTQRGRERGAYSLGQGVNSKGVTKRYLKNVTNEDRSGEESRSSEMRKVVTERSRSLSRLPAFSDSTTVQNGPTQSDTGPANKNVGQPRGRRSLDWQDSKTSTDTVKREESLNKYNTALTELPHTKSQDGFNMLLRRHGGSKRNSLLRWCQSQTQGYKNIDITNFSSSWADGLAFCAVYHTYLPSHIPYSTLTPENKRENLSLAFKTGEAVGIAQTLTVEEILRAGGPDWQRVLSYVESMYRHFEM
ncbi:cytospin-A [Mastacembelus armatus]|uniref:cytospin-A n=1 Tax=Mastacembelus armatus TaxID=205130 RepID=UPI000E45A87D|nr:cytospin-A-like [Mastacembelus armatus]